MKFVDRAVLIKDTLVITDIHLGYETSMQRRGVLIPKVQIKQIKEDLLALLVKTNPKTVVINGDLKHDFGTISEQEWREILQLVDLIQQKAKLVLVQGNHDAIMKVIARKKNLKLCDYYLVDDYFICHGDRLFDCDEFMQSKHIVIGHDHPAIVLRDGPKTEKFKCYVVASYEGKELIVLPSFTTLNEGTDVEQGRFLSPYLKGTKKLHIHIPNDEGVLDFGVVNLK